MYSKLHPEFITVTCLEWKPLLNEDRFKDIIVDSLAFLSEAKRITVYAFVIMRNHFHLVWQIMGDHTPEDVQRDFLKFTGQQILKYLRNDQSPLLRELFVGAKDRKYQVWERNSLSIPLWLNDVLVQKVDYIHHNPVRAGLCKFPEEYKYSSAGFYIENKTSWNFVDHYNG